MRVIAVQYPMVWEDKRATIDHLRIVLDVYRPEPGSLVVLPEMYSTGFSMKVAKIAEGEAREAERFLAEVAQSLHVTVTGGVVNRASDGRGLNQCVTVGPDGNEIARYTKMHPFSFAKEDKHYASGTAPVVYEWAGATVAPTICYDLRFPELYRAGVRCGAQLFTVIACWPARREAHWVNLLIARAIENQAYVVGVNRVGDDPWLSYGGRSLIVDPRGEILADAAASEGLISAEIDLDALRAYRAEFPALADMRGELLGTL